MDFEALQIGSPKRQNDRRPGWTGYFPYYAGYPESFAQKLLESARLPKGAMIVDPWNGSGTTTYSASRLGLDSIGVDLNPVMAVVARARSLPASEWSSILPLGEEILAKADLLTLPTLTGDPLLKWFGPTTATWLRCVERTIARVLLPSHGTPGEAMEQISAIGSTYMVALFTLCRELARSFQCSNPTWLRRLQPGERRASRPRSRLSERYIAILSDMADALAQVPSASHTARVRLVVQDTVRGLSSFRGIADFVLTSPPYCTRLDYTAATRLQLAVLAPLIEMHPSDLSRQMMGSVRVPCSPPSMQQEWGPTCVSFLRGVHSHTSKASSGYYYNTHLDYFGKLFSSLAAVRATLKPSAAAVVVIQDSFYKDLHNDLPQILIEMAAENGLAKRRREDFVTARTLAGRHPHTRTYRRSATATESVVCFQAT